MNVTVTAETVKSKPKLCFDKNNNNNNNKIAPEMADASYEGIRDAIVKPLLVEVRMEAICELMLWSLRRRVVLFLLVENSRCVGPTMSVEVCYPFFIL